MRLTYHRCLFFSIAFPVSKFHVYLSVKSSVLKQCFILDVSVRFCKCILVYLNAFYLCCVVLFLLLCYNCHLCLRKLLINQMKCTRSKLEKIAKF